LADLGNNIVGERYRDIDAGDLRADRARKRSNLDMFVISHDLTPPKLFGLGIYVNEAV
jgi:hypothetical protein